jgi:hypothetical protein
LPIDVAHVRDLASPFEFVPREDEAPPPPPKPLPIRQFRVK